MYLKRWAARLLSQTIICETRVCTEPPTTPLKEKNNAAQGCQCIFAFPVTVNICSIICTLWLLLVPCTGRMFGVDAALFDPSRGRCFDYSYAGYNAGESGIPTSMSRTVTLRTSNVRSYSDESTNGRNHVSDFQNAISDLQPGDVLNIPAGSYVLDRTLEVRKQNIIIRGAGSGRTKIIVPRRLSPRHSLFYFRGRVAQDTTRITDITATAERGASTLSVRSRLVGKRLGYWLQEMQASR
jgi:hypothetical protein